MTRFGEILPFWQNIQSLGPFLRAYFLFVKILDRLWQILHAIGQVFIEVNGQMLENNLAISSHWSGVTTNSLKLYELAPNRYKLKG